jgi:K+-sensing histidine kinase KdpD
VVPIAAFLHLAGIRPTLAAAVCAAVIGDYFFVQPVGAVTVHAEGLRLLVLLLLVS